jgi:hypothetical protein
MDHTMHTVVALAARLTFEAAREGVGVEHLSLHTVTGVALYAAEPALTPALAVILGLTERSVMENRDGSSVEFFKGWVDGIAVATHHVVPTAVLAAEQVSA